MKVKYIDLEMGLLAVVIAFTAFINISTFHIANYRDENFNAPARQGYHIKICTRDNEKRVSVN